MVNTFLIISFVIVLAILILILIIQAKKLKISKSLISELESSVDQLNKENNLLIEKEKPNLMRIEELEVDLKSANNSIELMKFTENLLKEEKTSALSRLEKLENSIIKISDDIPEKVKSINDLNNRKFFVSCWLRLQNEAFKSNALKVSDGKVTLNFIS